MKRRTLFPLVASFVLAVTMILSGVSAITWSPDTRLTFDLSDDWDPSAIQANDGRIWVAWHSGRNGNYDIFYKIRSGSLWSADIQLTSDSNQDRHPSILQSADGKIWVVWDSDRTIDSELYYKISVDNGASWSADTRLTFDPGRDEYPSIMQASDGAIWVFWTSSRNWDPDFADVFYKVSSDGGQTWSEDTHLPTDYKNNYRDDLFPSAIQATNGSIWMVWSKDEKDLYYKLYNGTGWSWEVQLTTDPNVDTHPFIMQTANERVWVFWDSDRNKYDDNVYYKVFDSSWSSDVQFTTAIEDDAWPYAMQADDLTIWVFWTSPRYPQLVYDVFYRTGMELHDLAVSGVAPSASHETFAFRGEVAYVEVEVQNQGEGKETFVVQCSANSTYLGSKIVTLNAGASFTAVFEWNTTHAKAGYYILSGTAVPVIGETDTADNTLTYNSFEVRIKGDLCGWYSGVLEPIPNQRVDIDDFGMAVGHFGTANPTWNPVWGPACDVTEDGVVDIDDVMTIGGHYLET